MDPKLVYPEFKFFKNNYVQMNKIDADYIYMSGKLTDSDRLYNELSDSEDNMGDYILVYFDIKSTFYKMYARFKVTTEFHKWLKDKCVRITTADFRALGNILKKNATDVEFTNTSVKFKHIDGEVELVNSAKYQQELDDNYKKLNDVDIVKTFYKDPKELDKDSIELFITLDDELVTTKTENKLIEVPTGSLKGIIKDGKFSISYSERNNLQQRYVVFVSRSPENDLEISQLFLTI